MSNLDCVAARELMLEAELTELEGTTSTPLSQHIASCAACRVRAKHLLKAYEELDSGLASLASVQVRKHTPLRWIRWAPAPLAAAALLALLLARGPDAPVQQNPLLLSLMFPEQPLITPPADKQAVVMEKNDLTVVWLY